MDYRRIKGMSDIYFPEIHKWHFIENKAREYYGARLYDEIRTPVVEYTNLFQRSIGEASDIVSKEMYTFEDRGGRSLTMRPEMTASVMRAAVENNLTGLREPLKLFYIGPMFRAERPQAGRKRQFYQLGVEVLADENPFTDVQVIKDLAYFLETIGFSRDEYSVKINNVGCDECRPKYTKLLKDYFAAKLGSLCKDCHFRFEKNVLRIFDCKNPDCKKVTLDAPKIGDNVCEKCHEHFEGVRSGLETFQVSYVVDKHIVRGLDYYTGTVFEVTSDKLGAQDAIGAGGRYNNLMKELGGPKKGAIGFALGMERILMCLEKDLDGLGPQYIDKTVYLAYADKKYIEDAQNLMSTLENNGIAVYADLEGRSLKSQMKRANKFGFRWALILNRDEFEAGQATLKDMRSEDKDQWVLDLNSIDNSLKEKINS